MPAASAPLPDPELGPAPIGGFFETHTPDGAAAGASVLEAWTAGRPYAAFVSARAAFAALVENFPGADVWLPAYICRDLAAAAPADRLRFYGVREGFEPDLAPVLAQARRGDLILSVAHFGQPLGDAPRAALARRPELQIVEDRAQALDAGPSPAGAWTLFSPRKLLGVADGGLLVGPPGARVPQPTGPADADALWVAPAMRRDDPAGRRNSLWHAANQAKEAAMSAAPQAMTAQSLEILAHTSLSGLSARRLANWRRLDARLRPWSALRQPPDSPPLGYVLRLAPEARARLLNGLHAARVFAAVHWPTIAAPAADFPREAAWTAELATLPCDHRYGPVEMDRIAGIAQGLLG